VNSFTSISMRFFWYSEGRSPVCFKKTSRKNPLLSYPIWKQISAFCFQLLFSTLPLACVVDMTVMYHLLLFKQTVKASATHSVFPLDITNIKLFWVVAFNPLLRHRDNTKNSFNHLILYGIWKIPWQVHLCAYKNSLKNIYSFAHNPGKPKMEPKMGYQGHSVSVRHLS